MKKIVLVISGLFLLFAGSSFAADGKGAEHRAMLGKSDFAKREKAAFMLSREKKDNLDKNDYAAVAELMEKEMERVRKASGLLMQDENAELPEELSHIKDGKRFDRYLDTLGAIVSKSGDAGYLPLVLNNRLDARSVVNFGDDAVGPVIDLLDDSDASNYEKKYAIRILGDMLRPKKKGYVAGGEKRNKIKAALKKTASGDDFSLVRGSMKALMLSGDKDVKKFRPDMKKLKRLRHEKKK